MVSKQSKLLRTPTIDNIDDILAILFCLFFLYAMYSWIKKHNIFSVGRRV